MWGSPCHPAMERRCEKRIPKHRDENDLSMLPMNPDFSSEKRIPKHGDENMLVHDKEKISFSVVKKESPNMGTKTPVELEPTAVKLK